MLGVCVWWWWCGGVRGGKGDRRWLQWWGQGAMGDGGRGEGGGGAERFPGNPTVTFLQTGDSQLLQRKQQAQLVRQCQISMAARAASAGCPRAFPGRLGPLAIQTEPTNKAPAGEGRETPLFPL